MKNSLIIDGQEINLSEETIRELKDKLGIKSVVEEMEDILDSTTGVPGRDSRCDKCFREGNFLYVYLPPHNGYWALGVFDAIKEFCSRKSNRYVTSGTGAKLHYIAIEVK